MTDWQFPDLGESLPALGLITRERTGDGRFVQGQSGVRAIGATGDHKVEFVGFDTHTLALVNSAMGYSAYYPVQPLVTGPLKAVLMDLDGTTVHSEQFWVWIIQLSTASLLGNAGFELEQSDLPYVSGHSVSEHLQYCIRKYCPDKTVEEARRYYFEHTHREMTLILDGRGRPGAFRPAPGLKDFLLGLKGLGVKIGLVTSGLYEKAYPEILDAFRTLGMGDPREFYDAIVTAGYAPRKGEVGTLGELSPKPHPWLYAETARVGLGIPPEQRGSVVGIEDSGAGICSIRLAGFMPLGVAGGNIVESGTAKLCRNLCSDLVEVFELLKSRRE